MLKERIAIITGAGSGIGKAVAIHFAEKGIKMIVTARNIEKLENLAGMLNQGRDTDICRVIGGDIARRETIVNCILECQRYWGSNPSIFLGSAGRGLPGTLLTSNEDEWDDLIRTNLKGLMVSLKKVSRVMIDSKGDDFVKNPQDIIVVGSTVGTNISPFNSVYGATKFAVHGLTEALRREICGHGIRVTLIEPGLVDTNFQETAGYDKDWFEKYAQEIGPVLTGDDIATAIDFIVGLPGNVHLNNISIRPTRQTYP